MSICRQVKQLIYVVAGQMFSSHGRLDVRKEHLVFHLHLSFSQLTVLCGAPLLTLEKCKLQTPISVKSQQLASELANKYYWEQRTQPGEATDRSSPR